MYKEMTYYCSKRWCNGKRPQPFRELIGEALAFVVSVVPIYKMFTELPDRSLTTAPTMNFKNGSVANLELCTQGPEVITVFHLQPFHVFLLFLPPLFLTTHAQSVRKGKMARLHNAF